MNTNPSSERLRRDDLSSPSAVPLDERARRYRTLFGAMEEGFCVIEMVFDEAGKPVDYHFLEFNDAFEHMTGITAEAALAGRSVRELFPTLEDHWYETYGQVAMSGESVRFENRAEAMGKWFEVHAFRIEGHEVGVLFKDITERKATEAERERLIAELEVERGRLQSLFKMSPSAIALLRGDDLRFEYANDAYLALVGREDVVGRTLLEALPDIEGQGFDALLRGVMATGEPFSANEVPAVLRPRAEEPARTIFVNLLYQAMREADGRVSGVFVHAVEVTDQVRSRKELEVEQEKLRTFFRLAPAFIAVLMGRDLVFEYVNDAYYEIVGHRPIVGLPLAQALPEAVGGGEGRDYDRLLREIMDAGEPRTFAERPVVLQRTPGAELEERFLDLAYLPLREADGAVSGILVHGIDVTGPVQAKVERERLVAALADEREMLDTVLNLSPSFVTIIRGESLTFEYANPAYKRAVGRDDLVGRTLAEALPES